jgi:hypothetical protein
MGGAKARAPLQAAADPNSYSTDDSLKKNYRTDFNQNKTKKSYVQTLLKRKVVLK